MLFVAASNRALKQISEYSGRLDLNSNENPEKKVEEFIKFLPVLCYDGETMNLLDAGQLLDMVVSGTASTMLARRWESSLLVNVNNETLKDVITQLEPALFRKVTGLTVPDFELLVSIGIFNAQVMNSAILAFKRYEEASLTYTGLNKHENEQIGLWDTKVTFEEMRQM